MAEKARGGRNRKLQAAELVLGREEKELDRAIDWYHNEEERKRMALVALHVASVRRRRRYTAEELSSFWV